MIIKTQRPLLRRRAFLGGVGTATIALPFLEGLPERSALAATDNPVYGLFICTANGVVQADGGEPERFWPTQVGPLTTSGMQAFAADRCTGLLADYADRLLIVRGVNYPFGLTDCGHAQGLAQCLTASRPNGSANNVTASGESIDSFIARTLTPGQDPLTLYSGMKQGYIDEKLSFTGPGMVRGAEGNPWNVYQRLVGLIPADDGNDSGDDVATQLAIRRKSVNDLVREELNALLTQSQLSQADRDRLDLHFQAIRDLEIDMVEMATACSDDGLDVAAMEALRSGNAFRADGMIEDVAKLQMELVALAFACNATRVATLQIGDGTDQTRYRINGETIERFHYVSHRVESNGATGTPIPRALEWHTAIDRIRMETFRHLLDRWSEYSTANGPLLDNGFAMWTSHVAAGPSHGFRNLPIIIGGSAGGFLRTGAYVDAGNVTNNKVFNTLATAMGADTSSFGDASLQGGLIDSMIA